MTIGALAATAANGLAGAILINAGIAKLVSPDRMPAAIREVAPALGDRVGPATVRFVAAAEVVVALGLLLATTRVIATVTVACLGVCFAVLGVAGRARRSTVACGCFGLAGDRPLGTANAAVGLALAALAPVNLFADAHAVPIRTVHVLPLTSLGVLMVCLLGNHRLIVRTVRAGFAAQAGSEVR